MPFGPGLEFGSKSSFGFGLPLVKVKEFTPNSLCHFSPRMHMYVSLKREHCMFGKEKAFCQALSSYEEAIHIEKTCPIGKTNVLWAGPMLIN